jgi:hypothetical protein
MRKCETQLVDALRARRAWHGQNTAVTIDTRQDGKPLALVTLHGNHIATVGYTQATDTFDGRPYPVVLNISVCLAGWNSVTTRSRLSAIVRAFANVGPHGLGVGSRNGHRGDPRSGQPSLHDANGKRDIDATGWHDVALRT